VSREEAARLSALDTGQLGPGAAGYYSQTDGGGGRSAALDDFRSRLQPTILGLPAAVAVLFGAAALVIIIMLIWIVVR
jgi:hypothetical protein